MDNASHWRIGGLQVPGRRPSELNPRIFATLRVSPLHYEGLTSLVMTTNAGAILELCRLAQILSLVGNPAALLADVFGIIDKRPQLLKVDIALTTGECTQLVWFTTH